MASMEFSGRLASFPIAELLQWAHNDRRTGALVIRRSSREKRIYFQRGRIVACLTDHTAEFYGQHLLLGGQIRQEQLLRALARCRKESKRLGLVLEEGGVLTREEVRTSLRKHIEDVVCDIFLWRHGVFFFRAEAPPEEEILAEPIDTLGIAFEGTRWIDEYARIRDVFEHDEIVVRRIDRGTTGSAVPSAVVKSGPRGERIYHAVDGEKTLEGIYSKIQGSYFQFLTTTYELYQGGILEVGDIFGEGGLTSVELSIQDVIFEQAATEHMRSSKRQIRSALGGLERLVPIWVEKPSDEEWDGMPDEDREFYRQLNGTKRLDDIFSLNEREWNHQMESLMLQLAKERIALLPSPLADLGKGDGQAGDGSWWDALRQD